MKEKFSCKGYVERITFRNDETGYTVFAIVDPEDGEEYMCVGNISYIQEGMFFSIEGREVLHKLYGPQIQVDTYKEEEPTETVAMEKYLGSGAIKGIGPKMAAKIIKKFGNKTFNYIENQPERLAEIKGISMKMAESINSQFREKYQMRSAMIFLQDYGIGVNLAARIYKTYGDNMYEILKNNPYKLQEDVAGVGFKTADDIALRSGFSQDSEYRIRSGILYMLNMANGSGHCYLPEYDLVNAASSMLGVEYEQVKKVLEDMILDREMITEEDGDSRNIYSTAMYHAELNCARMLLDLNITYTIDERQIEKLIDNARRNENIIPDELQKNAVMQVMKKGVTIITGGPGTGKTTTIKTLLSVLDEKHLEVLLAAPTGRAAKRMSETTGIEAVTIHRLLEITGGNMENNDRGNLHFERNEKHPLESDVIIVDEFSMVDIYLLHALLKAIVPGTRLVMVGDVNQLPSVGPGNVLRDMIQSDFCPVVRLSKIFRQAAESQIVVNAHKINAGDEIPLNQSKPDFVFLERNNSESVVNVMIRLITKELPPYLGVDPKEIQVLTPMKKGDLGVENLNVRLQESLNPKTPGKDENRFHDILFRTGDKVMQIKNNYQLKWKKRTEFGDVYEEGMGVFNGDIGIIQEIRKFDNTVIIKYDDERIVEYEFHQMDEVVQAYAITVHKSQGSEYPAVVMPVLRGARILMNRNLLYTAVTRAKQSVVIVGSSRAVQGMIHNADEQKRYSGLAKRIMEMGVD